MPVQASRICCTWPVVPRKPIPGAPTHHSNGIVTGDARSAIVGASRPEQVRANASASGIELDAETLAAIDSALGDVVYR